MYALVYMFACDIGKNDIASCENNCTWRSRALYVTNIIKILLRNRIEMNDNKVMHTEKKVLHSIDTGRKIVVVNCNYIFNNVMNKNVGLCFCYVY